MEKNTPWKILASSLPEKENYYTQDPVLQTVLGRLLRPETFEWLKPQVEALGETIPEFVEPRSALVDREVPQLKSFDRYGRRVDEIVYHPAYRELEGVAYGSGMVAIKYDPELRARFGGDLQVAGFAMSFLYSQAEMGVSCPVCMTDGVARVLDLHGSEAQKAERIPELASRNLQTLKTGAMFLTEKQGGSDVGRNATRAVQQPDGTWRLYGEKWFCSNVDAGYKLVLARPEGASTGTRGLGLFLLPHRRADGSLNAIRIDRLKDKLGVRSMASGECVLEGSEAQLVGRVEDGFRHMAEMLNLSRLWNAICSVGVMRRVVHETTTYLRRRVTFGKRAIEHPLVRQMLADMNAEQVGALLLTLQLSQHLDRADAGGKTDAELVRILTPLAKYTTAKAAVWIASEGIELQGGNGYIEDSPLPRLLRDAQVLPVWEGTTNILILDTLRVISKSGAHEVLWEETLRRAAQAPLHLEAEAALVVRAVERSKAELAVIAAQGPDESAPLLRGFTDRLLYAYAVSLAFDPQLQASAMGKTFAAAGRRLLARWIEPELKCPPEDVAALVDDTVVETVVGDEPNSRQS